MTKEAKEFWTSPAAMHFPESLLIDEISWLITEGGDYYRKTFKKLNKKGWIPQSGPILEFGAGASSGLVFPEDIVKHRLTATDISPLLLAQNPVPKARKRVFDAGSDIVPPEWNNRFSLVFAMHLSRYLDGNEKIRLAHNAKHLLSPCGRLLLLDTPQTPNREVAAAIGEAGPFNTEQECAILEGAGFANVGYGSFFVEFFERTGDRTGTHIDYVTGTSS